MEIKVLGTGCAGCKALEATVREVVSEMSLDAKVEKVEDIMKIMDYNVMSMPGLVINEKVVSAGKRLSKSEVKEILSKLQKMPLGTAIAFMMSVVGLSLPEATLLKKVMTWKLIGIFFGTVTLFIILSGYIFNIFL